MTLPIVAYGDPVLRKKAIDISSDYEQLQTLISDMFETMEASSGVGLAAPQIGRAIRLFVIDSTNMYRDEDDRPVVTNDPFDQPTREVFINAVIQNETGKEWKFEEGCLSIPGIREDVERKPEITITYLDAALQPQSKTFRGLTARVIQHEYDHIEGILFIDRIKPLKRTILKGRLEGIAKGDVNVKYKMRFPKR